MATPFGLLHLEQFEMLFMVLSGFFKFFLEILLLLSCLVFFFRVEAIFQDLDQVVVGLL